LSLEVDLSLWSRLFHSATGDQYHKGIRYFNDGDYDHAIECLEQVVVEDRTRESPVAKLGAFYASEAHSKLGVAEFHRRNYDRALEHFASALKINPHYPDLYYYLGVVHHKKNDLPAAIRSPSTPRPSVFSVSPCGMPAVPTKPTRVSPARSRSPGQPRTLSAGFSSITSSRTRSSTPRSRNSAA